MEGDQSVDEDEVDTSQSVSKNLKIYLNISCEAGSVSPSDNSCTVIETESDSQDQY